MSYLKFLADQLFTGTELISDQSILITDNKGIVIDIVAIEDAGDDVQYHQGIISPGFVNAHCHLELSHMKGLIPEHTGLPNFILKIVNERHFPEEEIITAIAKAEDEMIANGIVAVGDICNNTLTIDQKKLNRLAYYNFIEVSGWKPVIANPRYEHAQKVLKQFTSDSRFIIHNSSLSPHAPYSVSNELWKLLMPHFDDNSVTIHNQETKAEDDLFKTGTGNFIEMYQAMNIDQTHFTPTGKSSLQSYFEKLSFAKNKILVHNTNTTENDILFTKGNDVFFCLCPNANLYIENNLPPIDLLRKYQSNIIIGTDSLASNHSLSILDELKTISKNFTSIPLEEMLQWATLNGAKALQMDDAIGSFEKGKKPGVILLKGSSSITINDDTSVMRLIV